LAEKGPEHLSYEFPVYLFAKANGIPIHLVHSMKDWQVPIATSGPFDLGVVVSFGRLIPNQVLDALPLGAINMHPSLLPKYENNCNWVYFLPPHTPFFSFFFFCSARYRGAAPIYHAMLNNDEETGISIVEISRNKFDSGKILLQQKVVSGKGKSLLSF
jgi:methionyl-tRNA formyltransferase